MGVGGGGGRGGGEEGGRRRSLQSGLVTLQHFHCIFIPECLVEEQLRVTASKCTVLAASVTSHRRSEPKVRP